MKAIPNDNHPGYRGDRSRNCVAVMMTSLRMMTTPGVVVLGTRFTVTMDFIMSVVSELTDIYVVSHGVLLNTRIKTVHFYI